MDKLFTRKQTKLVQIGAIGIGGTQPIAIQSMTTTKTADVVATVAQIKTLQAAGCEIIRLAIPDQEAACAISSIKAAVTTISAPFSRAV